jgi:hypothetical protein
MAPVDPRCALLEAACPAAATGGTCAARGVTKVYFLPVTELGRA